jgi:hypothetical protein
MPSGFGPVTDIAYSGVVRFVRGLVGVDELPSSLTESDLVAQFRGGIRNQQGG